MAQGLSVLLLLASVLFCPVLCEVENSSEETEKEPGREAKYIVPPFGRLPSDSAPCASTEVSTEISKHSGVDPDNIVISRIFLEEKEPPNSEISELLQLLREFKKHNFGVPQHYGHFTDPAAFSPTYHSMHSGDDLLWALMSQIPTDRGGFPQTSIVGYPPVYPYPLSVNPSWTSPCGSGPCNQYPCHLSYYSYNSLPRNLDPLEQELLGTHNTGTLTATSFENTYNSPNALQDPFSITNYPNTNGFLSRPAESFEEVMVHKHQQKLPNYPSWPYSESTTEELTAGRYYIPSTVRIDDPLSVYNPATYRSFHTTPTTTIEEVHNTHYSPTQNAFSSGSTMVEEESPLYYPTNYKTHKGLLLKSADDGLTPYHPANHRRVHAEDIAISHYPSSFGGNPSPVTITTEEVSTSLYPSRFRTHYSPSAHTSYMTQSHYPATVTSVEETVVDVPATFAEEYYPVQYPGRYLSTNYPHSELVANNGYDRAYYSRYPMYQTNG